MRWVFLIFMGFCNAVYASVPPAYTLIANEFGIPDKLLYAVALTESLHPEYKKPWPWAANIDGKAFYFESRDEMFLYLSRIARNKSNFDVGIMQTNWKWQKHRFDSLRDATDPLVNIRAGDTRCGNSKNVDVLQITEPVPDDGYDNRRGGGDVGDVLRHPGLHASL